MSGHEQLDSTDDPGAPDRVFEVDLNGEPQARVFAPKQKRNWVLWKLSQYVVALNEHGDVTVRQWINGEWRKADDWRNLAH